MSHFLSGNKYLEAVFNRLHKNRMFWVNMVMHWETLLPKKRIKMLAGAAFGLFLIILFFALGFLFLAQVCGVDFSQILGR